MNVRSAVEALLEIERRMDVTQLGSRDIAVWPLLRIICFGHLMRSTLQGTVERTEAPRRTPMRNAWQIVRRWKQRRDLRQLAVRGQRKIWVMSDAAYHTDRIGGRLYDRFADPLLEILPAGDAVKLEFMHRDIGPRNMQPQQIDLRYSVYRAGADTDRSRIAHYGEFEAVFRQVAQMDPPSELEVIEQLARLKCIAADLEPAIRTARPRAVFVVCYYSLERMALTLACRRAGVPVIDMQHGKQGSYNAAYTHFSRLPESGWELLPDRFWVWGDESRANIELHLPDRCTRHRPVVGGNIWMALWRQRGHFTPDAAHGPFLDSLSRFGKTILVSLQPLAEPLPPHLLEAMGAAPEDWRWLIRMHPNMLASKPALQARIEAVAPGRFELDMASAVPLYALLARVTHHVTCWSTVAYEALAFAVPTTLIDKTALELYADYIGKNHFGYATDAKGILEAIRTGGSRLSPERSAYIITDLGHAQRTLNVLLEEVSG